MKYILLIFCLIGFNTFSQIDYKKVNLKNFGSLETKSEYLNFSKYLDSMIKVNGKTGSFNIKINAAEYALERGKLSLSFRYLLECERDFNDVQLTDRSKLKFYWLLGLVYFNYKSEKKAISNFRKVANLETDSSIKVSSYNYLGILYRGMNDYKLSKHYFQKGLNFAVSKKMYNWVGIFTGNIAFLNYKKGYMVLAEIGYQKSLKLSMKTKEHLYAILTIQQLCLIYLETNRFEKFNETIEFYRKNKELLANSETDLSKQVELLNMYSQNKDYELIRGCFDVLRFKDSLRSKVDYESFQNYQLNSIQYEAYISSLKLQNEKQRILLLSIILSVVFISLVIILYVSYKKQKQKRKFEKMIFERNQMEKEKQINQMNKELNILLAKLIDKTNLVSSLEDQIDTYSEKLEKSVQDELTSLKENIQSLTLIKEEDLEKFEELFELVFPDFTNKLKKRFPNITKGEMRYASLVKLNIKRKNLLGILSVSDHAIRKIDLRLRKKLNIEGSSEDLKIFIDQL